MTRVYEIAWASELKAELARLYSPEGQRELQRRAEELKSDIQWQALKLRYQPILAYARRCQAEPTRFSATPLGIEHYVIYLMALRPFVSDEQREWITEKIKPLLEIAEETREVRTALLAMRQEEATPQ